MNDKLKKLYKSVILRHNKQPYHYCEKQHSDYQIEAYNPLCGDRFQLYLDIRDEVIHSIDFYGFGCMLSKSATSVMAAQMEGKSIEEALALCNIYRTIISHDYEKLEEENEELAAFSAVKEFPARLKCVLLSWETMESFLKGKY